MDLVPTLCVGMHNTRVGTDDLPTQRTDYFL